jgi:hypothetical protein
MEPTEPNQEASPAQAALWGADLILPLAFIGLLGCQGNFRLISLYGRMVRATQVVANGDEYKIRSPN